MIHVRLLRTLSLLTPLPKFLQWNRVLPVLRSPVTKRLLAVHGGELGSAILASGHRPVRSSLVSPSCRLKVFKPSGLASAFVSLIWALVTRVPVRSGNGPVVLRKVSKLLTPFLLASPRRRHRFPIPTVNVQLRGVVFPLIVAPVVPLLMTLSNGTGPFSGLTNMLSRAPKSRLLRAMRFPLKLTVLTLII